MKRTKNTGEQVGCGSSVSEDSGNADGTRVRDKYFKRFIKMEGYQALQTQLLTKQETGMQSEKS